MGLIHACGQERLTPAEEVAEAIVRCLGAENPEDDVAVLVVEV